MAQSPVHLLSLPYDVRHLVYQNLFPQCAQIYLLAGGSELRIMNQEDSLPPSILRVCRLLHQEAAEYLYNNYLFNVVGLKQDCLALYKPFLRTFEKHSRQLPRVDAFSNGDHSATMCVSVQAGNARLSILDSRRRGKPRSLEDLLEEVAAMPRHPPFDTPGLLADVMGPVHRLLLPVRLRLALLPALIVLIFALLLAIPGTQRTLLDAMFGLLPMMSPETKNNNAFA